MIKSLVLSLLLLAPWSAAAAAEGGKGIEIRTVAEVETKVDGTDQVKREPAKKVPPGVAVIYTISAANTGAKPASDVVVTDPIPEHMDYVDGSATSEGARLSFSVDGGKTFAAKDKLQVRGKDGGTRAALSTDYTHIRWQFEKPLAPGESRAVEFRARVE
jgi:uncharacterized repeat protein (TIGR01451 family)